MPLGLGLAASHAPTVWRPVETWPAALEATVRWYQAHAAWVERARANAPRETEGD